MLLYCYHVYYPNLGCEAGYGAVSILGFFDNLRGHIDGALNYLEWPLIFPVVVVFLIALFFFYYRKITQPLAGTTEWIEWEVNKPRLTFMLRRHPMEKRDAVPLAIITVAFSFLALFRLGDTTAPQSFYQFTESDRRVVIELNEPMRISEVMFYTGMWTGHYTLEFSTNGTIWIEQKPGRLQNTDGTPARAMEQTYAHLFKWRYADFLDSYWDVSYVRLTASRTPIELGELALYDAEGALIPNWQISSPDAPELFDEQHLIPPKPEYMNSMYFDEIYHGRTALEHLRNIMPYEITHPPLGKEIIASSIHLFGMTPFGWRFIGAVFGVVMLIVMYIFLKNMFGKTVIAVCGTLLLGFDFMRFVQTRIATIDTYGVFFILVSFFFMYRHITTAADAPFRKSLTPLALSGLFFGFGCAAKWIVPYAGIGLAAIYIIRLVLLWRHYNESRKPGFAVYLTKTLAFSVLFFGVIPVIIYCLSYIPYGLARGMTIGEGMLWDPEYYKIIWENQVSMLSYHGELVATHAYSSWWYQWIINGRPILYYLQYDGNLRSSFAAFGNPVVWWGGFIAMVAIGIRAVRRRDGKALFILIGYLSQLLPWVVVSRIVFIYHYFPSTLFIVMALAHVFNTILERGQGRYKQAVYGYTASAGVLFFMFYPALTGIYAPNWYFRYLLRWIPGAWPF